MYLWPIVKIPTAVLVNQNYEFSMKAALNGNF